MDKQVAERKAWLEAARSALALEAAAIQQTADRLGPNLLRAVETILNTGSKLVVTGMGKSGHVGRKIAATLRSTGTPAVFLHAAEAAHGDLGLYVPGDPTLIISKSGSTAELVRLIPMLRRFGSTLIGILGNPASPLGEKVDILLDGRIEHEADPLDLAPTCSSTVALALGDALAVALMKARRFSERDFALTHPAGQLGRNLLLRVEDVMHQNGHVAWVGVDDSLKRVVIEMTQYPLGAACVVDDAQKLLGIITDGDVRRALQEHTDIQQLTAAQIMTRTPVTVLPSASLQEAVSRMEERPSQISVLPVVDDAGGCRGLIRLHDIYQAEVT
jgi:arabinose-5-phosphate isomerase